MTLSPGDWVVILLYFATSAAIGLGYTRRGGKSSRSLAR